MNSHYFSTPILFLIFNRPDTTKKVFDKIRQLRPRLLFISADGPRPDKTGEGEKCKAARNIIQHIDWTCEVRTNFLEKNLGCRVAVSSGIDWFFSHVPEGIILEDDCCPDLSFFPFCETMLGTYRSQERIMHVGGTNFQDGRLRGDGSYYISNLGHVWGWATWKRAWQKYDVDIPTFRSEEHRLLELFPDRRTRAYWQKNFESVYYKKKDTWDYQWQYALSTNNGLAIIPNVNLISNIGFDANATHTTGGFPVLANRPTGKMDNIRHPKIITPDLQADEYTFRKYLQPNKLTKLWRLLRHYFPQ